MSDSDYYIEVRATAKTTIGKTVRWLGEIHPDLWEDKPALRSCLLHDLNRVAAERNATIYEDTLKIEELHRLPMFEHQRRKITD